MTEHALPVGGTSDALRTIQQNTAAGVVQTEVVVETDLTVTVIGAVTVTGVDSVIVAASSGIRLVVLSVPTSADTGIYVNVAAAATSSSFLVEAGGVWRANTAQAIHALRAGSTNVTAYVMTAVPSS